MIVLKHIAGSHCVVELNRPCENWAVTYIDARQDVRYPGFTLLEVVVQGQVRLYDSVHNSAAAERIIELTKEYR